MDRSTDARPSLTKLRRRAERDLVAARTQVAELEAFLRKFDDLTNEDTHQKAVTALDAAAEGLGLRSNGAAPPEGGRVHGFMPGTARAFHAQHADWDADGAAERARLWDLWAQGRPKSKQGTPLAFDQAFYIVRARLQGHRRSAETRRRIGAETTRRMAERGTHPGRRKGSVPWNKSRPGPQKGAVASWKRPVAKKKKRETKPLGPVAAPVVRLLQADPNGVAVTTIREQMPSKLTSSLVGTSLAHMAISGIVRWKKGQETVHRGPAFDDAIARLPK